jgi:hypothetical protein
MATPVSGDDRSRVVEPTFADVAEFALVVEPLKIQGGTGSTVAPIAIR